MGHSKAAWLTWTLCAATVILALLGLMKGLRQPAAHLDALSAADGVLIASYNIVFGAVGTLIVSRQTRNTIGWLLLVMALSITFLSVVLDGRTLASTLPSEPTLANLLATWLSSWGWWLLIGPLLLILLLFPTGRPPSPRWKWVIVLLAATFVVFLGLATFGAVLGDPAAIPPLRNPIGVIPEAMVLAILPYWTIPLIGSAALCASAVFVRYRRAGPVERQQIKWLLLASGVFIAVYIVAGILSDTAAGHYFQIVFDLSILAIPLAIGVAILRYRLWDIDLIIRRTLIYAVLTGLLALAYFGSVVILQNTFSAVTGQSQSTLVTVLSTLVIAALFVPLRRRVQAVIDRRLYRSKYDAARILGQFGASVRDETDLDALSQHLTDAIRATMQPAHASLWLRKGKGQ